MGGDMVRIMLMHKIRVRLSVRLRLVLMGVTWVSDGCQ